MGAAETIQAAIDKLESLRIAGELMVQATEEGDWMVTGVAFDEPYLVTDDEAVARLFVMMHETVDPQIAILRTALAATRDDYEWSAALAGSNNELDLARAILGEVAR